MGNRGREVQQFHKSQIDADLADLKKFEIDGSLNPRVSIYNGKLRIDISDKAQVNMYATWLHEVGSSSVEHYSMLEIRDLAQLGYF